MGFLWDPEIWKMSQRWLWIIPKESTFEKCYGYKFLKLHNYMVLPWSPSKSFLLMAPKRPEGLIHFFASKTWILKTSDLEICLNFISTYTSTNIHLYFKSYGKTAFQRTGFDRCCKNLKYWWDNTQATHCNAFNHERGKIC